MDFYKAVFNQAKLIRAAETLNLGHEDLIDLGEFFVSEGFMHGTQFFGLALDSTSDVNVKVKVAEKILETERKRDRASAKL